jgi:hypothetical protein
MDWDLAIKRNRDALLRVIGALFAMAGLTSPLRGEVSRAQARNGEGQIAGLLLTHQLYRAILAILRPAESAVRRLIMIAARGLTLAPRQPRPAPVGLTQSTDKARIPTFCLMDPLKRFVPCAICADEETNFWNVDGEEEADDEAEDAAFIHSIPRISIPGFVDPVFAPPKPQLPAGYANAHQLRRRLLALKHALDNLEKQARRLARWKAKRDSLRQQFPLRPQRLSTLRPGLPPGYRQRRTHEIDEILRECHGLVRDACAEANTS